MKISIAFGPEYGKTRTVKQDKNGKKYILLNNNKYILENTTGKTIKLINEKYSFDTNLATILY